MNILKAYGRGFRNSLRHPRMILLIFAITLLLGLSLALPFFFSFKSSVGNSVVTNLDYTTMSELMNFHSWNLDSIMEQGKFTVIIFWLLMVFFVGGIVRTFNREDFTVGTFFSGAGVNFFRYLVCDIIMISLMLVTAVVLFGISNFILSLFQNQISETPLFWAYGIAAFILGCTVVLFLMISDYAKFYMEMAETSRVLKAIGKAVKFVFNNFLKTYFLYALLLVIPFVALVLYKLTFDKIGMNTAFGIIAMFFVQQIFIILRVWFRVWSLSSQFELYADDYVQIISFDIDTDKLNKEPEQVKVVEQELTTTTTTTTTTTSKTTVINSDGDTFRTTVVEEQQEKSEQLVEESLETKENKEPESKEPETEEQLSKFYAQDQNDGTECNLADLTPKKEEEKTEKHDETKDSGEKKYDVEVIDYTTNGKDQKEIVETEAKEKEEEVAANESKTEVVIIEQEPEQKPETETVVEEKEPETVVIETKVINDEGDTFTKIVNTETETVVTTETVSQEKSDSEPQLSIFGEPISDSDSYVAEEKSEPEETEDPEEPDDIDEALLAQFYDNESSDEPDNSDNSQPAKNESDQHEVVDIDDFDESVGSSVPLDFDDDDDDVETTVTTTTTTTTTTITTTTTETVTDPDEPKVIKIYTEQEMREIAQKQLESAGIEPDLALTEVVSEDSPDGVPSGEYHTEDEFVEAGLKDGDDFNDPDGEAFG